MLGLEWNGLGTGKASLVTVQLASIYCVLSLTHSFSKHLWSAYCIPNTVISPGETTVPLCPHSSQEDRCPIKLVLRQTAVCAMEEHEAGDGATVSKREVRKVMLRQGPCVIQASSEKQALSYFTRISYYIGVDIMYLLHYIGVDIMYFIIYHT